MAGSSLLTLLDDIAAVLDDVSVMTKMEAKKTSGVLGDDLALNAQQVTGVRADRELPVVWSVAKGSFINKLILVPLVLLISAFLPWAITPLLMLGGAYLCFEGAEKIAHKLLHPETKTAATMQKQLSPEMLSEFESKKIKGAIRTDFVLSAEIIAITLGIVSSTTFMIQVIVLSIIAIVMTIGVYGLVAGIVKLDDLGFYLQKKASTALKKCGNALIYITPYLMKTLSIVGTAAMFMVGGGILTHGISYISEWIDEIAFTAILTPIIGSTMQFVLPTIINLFFGLIVGLLLVAIINLFKKLKKS